MTYIFGSTIALQRHIIMAGLKIKDFGRHPRGIGQNGYFCQFPWYNWVENGKEESKSLENWMT